MILRCPFSIPTGRTHTLEKGAAVPDGSAEMNDAHNDKNVSKGGDRTTPKSNHCKWQEALKDSRHLGRIKEAGKPLVFGVRTGHPKSDQSDEWSGESQQKPLSHLIHPEKQSHVHNSIEGWILLGTRRGCELLPFLVVLAFESGPNCT